MRRPSRHWWAPSSLPAQHPGGGKEHGSAILPQTALNDQTDGVARLQFAQTEWCPWRLRLLDGEVHDENTFALEAWPGMRAFRYSSGRAPLAG